MELSKSDLIVRWAYLNETTIPERVTLCVLFWRSLAMVPLVGTLAALLVVFSPVWVPAFLWETYGQERVREWLAVRRARTMERRKAKRIGQRPSEHGALSVLVKGALAVKGKVCPIVTIR